MYSVYLMSPQFGKTVVYTSNKIKSACISAGRIYSQRHHKRIDVAVCDNAGKVLLKLSAKYK